MSRFWRYPEIKKGRDAFAVRFSVFFSAFLHTYGAQSDRESDLSQHIRHIEQYGSRSIENPAGGFGKRIVMGMAFFMHFGFSAAHESNGGAGCGACYGGNDNSGGFVHHLNFSFPYYFIWARSYRSCHFYYALKKVGVFKQILSM